MVQSIDACAGAFSTFKEINIPSTIKEIKKFAFSNNKSITSIYIPKNVLYMGERIFTGCLNVVVNIEHSEVPSSWDEYWKTSNVSVKLNCSF